MPFDLSIFAPDDLPLWLSGLLVLTSFLSSLLTAVMGLGGGLTMLAALGVAFPPAIVIPFHGLIQLGSNFGRAIVQRAHIQWHLLFWFALGSVIGAAIGGSLAISLPEWLFRIMIGAFILYSVWGRQPEVSGRGPVANVIAGSLMAALSMIIGAVGPLVMNYLRTIADRRQLVGTHAAAMVFNNTAKVVAFMAFGFAFGRYMPLIVAMILAGFAGTIVGSRFLERMPEANFRIGLKIVLTILALEMIRAGLFSL